MKAATENNTVVAAYYGGWKNPPDSSSSWMPQDVWGTTPEKNWFVGDYPEVHPLEGNYNEDSQEVVDNQINAGAEAGVDVFALNWYRDDFVNHTPSLFAASQADPNVKFCLQWSNHYDHTLPSGWPAVGNRSFLFEGMRRAALRMSSPRYWYKDGMPVFILFTADYLDEVIRQSVGQAVGYIPSTAERSSLIGDLHKIVGNVRSGDTSGGISGTGSSAVVSGAQSLTTYLVLMAAAFSSWGDVYGVRAITQYQLAGASPYSELMNSCLSTWRVYTSASARTPSSSVKYWPCVMSGWDKRPWGSFASVATPTVDQFKRHVVCANAFIRENREQTDGVAFVYAWNEFAEGGFIAPSVKYGTELGRLVKSYLS